LAAREPQASKGTLQADPRSCYDDKKFEVKQIKWPNDCTRREPPEAGHARDNLAKTAGKPNPNRGYGPETRNIAIIFFKHFFASVHGLDIAHNPVWRNPQEK